MSHVDNHEISNQDNQWAKAMGQDMSYQVSEKKSFKYEIVTLITVFVT